MYNSFFASYVRLWADALAWAWARSARATAKFVVRRGDVAEQFDLKSPSPTLERQDSKEVRDKILSLSASEARRLGLSKTTVHYLRKNARDRKPFKIYKRVLKKFEDKISARIVA